MCKDADAEGNTSQENASPTADIPTSDKCGDASHATAPRPLRTLPVVRCAERVADGNDMAEICNNCPLIRHGRIPEKRQGNDGQL